MMALPFGTLQSCYRTQCKMVHPDKCSNPAAHMAMTKLNEAWDQLSNNMGRYAQAGCSPGRRLQQQGNKQKNTKTRRHKNSKKERNTETPKQRDQ